jgi:hypothetical protein
MKSPPASRERIPVEVKVTSDDAPLRELVDPYCAQSTETPRPRSEEPMT